MYRHLQPLFLDLYLEKQINLESPKMLDNTFISKHNALVCLDVLMQGIVTFPAK